MNLDTEKWCKSKLTYGLTCLPPLEILGLCTFYKPNCSVDDREVHTPASSGQHPRLLLHSVEVSTLIVMNTLGANDNTVTDCGDTHHHREPLDITGSECLHQLVGTESSVLT